MSQARVTDFFSQRKKGAAGPTKPHKTRSSAAIQHGPSRTSTHVATSRSRKGGDSLCSSSIREEFVRVIDEAVRTNEGESDHTGACKSVPSSPRTPKRTSVDCGFDLGAAVFSATADHSTAKKRRQAEANREAANGVQEKETRRRARKKLVLPQEASRATDQPQPSEVSGLPSAAEVSQPGHHAENHTNFKINSSPPQDKAINTDGEVQSSKTLSKDGVATLKARLQRIKKHADAVVSHIPDASSSPSASPAVTTPKGTRSPTLKATPLHPSEAKSVQLIVARASELAAKAQKRKEEQEVEEAKQSETPAQECAEAPAYQRYHTLAQAVPPGLSLPYQYKVLAEMFRSMDTVVAMLYNRYETATFTKVKQGVQDMMHKRFEESHVGQIKTVFPEAYTFRQEKNIPNFNSSIKKGSHQLTVEPVLPPDQNNARPVLSASALLNRRHVFHQNLVSIVKQHHKVFLSSLVPPVSVPEDKLTRWHPRFNVDTVPAVQVGSLPQPPHTEKLATAQEVLDKARSLITPKMEKALVSLAQKTPDKDPEGPEPTSPQNPTAAPAAQLPTALKGVSQSLLDRIRAKEAQKLQAAMMRNSNQEERLLMMSRLPELARILRNVFVSEKKPALIMEVACNRMVASYRSALSTGEMEKHIRLLAEVAANWLTIHPIRKDFYLKINKAMELNIVLDKLSSRLREEERL